MKVWDDSPRPAPNIHAAAGRMALSEFDDALAALSRQRLREIDESLVRNVLGSVPAGYVYTPPKASRIRRAWWAARRRVRDAAVRAVWQPLHDLTIRRGADCGGW